MFTSHCWVCNGHGSDNGRAGRAAQGQGLVSLTPPARPGSRGAGAGLTQAQ
jgi:hypothetical protein